MPMEIKYQIVLTGKPKRKAVGNPVGNAILANLYRLSLGRGVGRILSPFEKVFSILKKVRVRDSQFHRKR